MRTKILYVKDSFLFVVAFILCLFKTAVLRVTDVDDILRRYAIIPDVIDEAPEFIMNVSFRQKEFVRTGHKVDPAVMQRAPMVYWPAEPGILYTLLMIDPDVPVRKNPTMAQRQHWIVGNIPLNDFRRGETITGYCGPVTPKNSGLHRTTFLVYSQKKLIRFTEPRIPAHERRQRYKFSSRKFAEKYNLTIHAVNFCCTGWPLYGIPTRSPHRPFKKHVGPTPKTLEA